MFFRNVASRFKTGVAMVCLISALGLGGVLPVQAQSFPAFRQALAEGASFDSGVSAFYRDREFAPIWVGAEHADRRAAFMSALARAGDHGLPVARYDVPGLVAAFEAVESERDRAMLEAKVTRVFLSFASDLHSGVVDPGRIERSIVRELPRPDPEKLLREFAQSNPASFIRNLAPAAPEYARLFRAKQQLEAVIRQGGWGPRVPEERFAPGTSGDTVIALRNRLIAMGYMDRSATASYDSTLQSAVLNFQVNHGIEADGIAGPATIRAMNVSPEERLKSVIVAMERERWLNIPRGDRHIWVNLTDFSAKIVDFDQVTFETRAVVGAQAGDRQTPEFSHRMTYLEINPDWTLPRSILARSYWGALASGGARHLEIVDARGRVVPRHAIDFERYTPANFPFNVRQPPGPTNALGEVKFMFPNPYAIYLHDSPERHLFNTTVRTHSSGCVRLNDPRDFAYELLSRQSDDPRALYHSVLNTRQQTRVYLDEPVQIHLVYRTAFTNVRGELNFRNDIYGRDARIYDALERAGAVNGIQS
ncbi:L,D-transpeptidase family protein [Roseinatronobacter alkalisoli]|uniref:L,D-transpeptidase family protein n=1 Tax=Roseinatronobacter alkalisoli TaxID=3028235 RepID=A0ABT5T463_9RHOB|nr:L,D-transpeptidase family protein [Roseinatronobacter sp. HJB301]MDD7969913.1 L,D-transpeptidase family protein [Roseinatronobacter sp. HJB301]